jgi:hypothetical protein
MRRYGYSELDDTLIGQRLAVLSHEGEDPHEALDAVSISLRDDLRRTKPEIRVVRRLDDSVAIGVGDPQRGLDEITAGENATTRRATGIDDRPVQGWSVEYGVGPDGWIEVAE